MMFVMLRKKPRGIYLVYELKNGRIELVYIGSSGKVQNNGQIKRRNGGISDRIVNYHQFGKTPRKIIMETKNLSTKKDKRSLWIY